jgi:phosphate starvation-inducible PhoH-like protein
MIPCISLLLLNALKTGSSYKYKNTLSHKMLAQCFFSHYKSNINIPPFSYKIKDKNVIRSSMKKNHDYDEEIPHLNEPYSYSNSHKKNQKIITPVYEPKTENQKKYVEFLNNKDNTLIVAVGSAGSGKTMYACLKAVELLKSKQIRKIIITRPVVSVEEDIGFLPGTIESKMDPYMRPIFDIFTEFFSVSEWNDMVFSRVIEISPLAYMRGRTFKNCFIIADEMQNSSPNQMKMLLTRIGDNSRMVLTGDLSQTDKVEYNGLKEFIDKLEKYPKHLVEKSHIRTVYLNNSDIQRHPLVESVLNIYEYKKSKIRSIEKIPSIKKNITVFINDTVINNENNKFINKIVINETVVKKKFNITEPIKKTDNDCALIPIHHMPNNDMIQKYKSPNFKDWSREIGL